MTIHNASPRTKSFYVKRSVGFVLLMLLAGLFLFSGISKLYAFSEFSWHIMDAGVTNLTTAAILARTLIGCELLLGIFLLAHLYLKSFTLHAVIGVLLLFSLYLFSLLLQRGNAGDCGCFGDAYAMSPVGGIIKNIIAAAVAFVLYYIYPIKPYKNAEWIAAFGGMASMALPFILFPLSLQNKAEVVHETVYLAPLYASSNPKNTPPDIDLRSGKQIVAFLSLTCPHCKKAAYSLQIIERQHPEIPIYLVLNGNPALLKDFLKETDASRVPYSLFQGGQEFIKMAGESVPAIYWINNGIAERESNIFQLDPDEMQAWLQE